jgi:hypothetical protein
LGQFITLWGCQEALWRRLYRYALEERAGLRARTIGTAEEDFERLVVQCLLGFEHRRGLQGGRRCGSNWSFWFFAGGLTNLETTITVTDTLTGRVKTYTNPQGTAFRAIQDTKAFSCQ